MAEYILNVVEQGSKLDWAMPFQRTGAFPLDRSSVFSSYADAVKYAAGAGDDERGLGGTSYVGQTISVYNNGSVTLYIIEADRSLKEVGSAPAGDNVSIEFADGKLQVKGFGKGYYKYVPATSDEAEKYQFVADDFIAGLEPRVVTNSEGALEIAWYQPSNKEFYTKTETDTLIKTAINNADHLKRKIVTATGEIDLTAKDADQYIYMVPNGLQHDDDKYDEYIVIEGKLEKVGDWEVDLTGYYTKVEVDDKIAEAIKGATGGETAASVKAALEAYKTANDAKVKALETDVAALKAVGAEKNFINSVDTNFTVGDDRKLVLNDISVDKVTGLQDTLTGIDGKIQTIESNITTINSGIQTINGSITTIQGNITTIQGDITNINQKITSLEGTIQTIPSNYVTIEKFNVLEGDVSNLKELLTWKEMEDLNV